MEKIDLYRLDKPFAGVDLTSIQDIKNTILHLKERHIGVLNTNYNVRETLQLCGQTYIMSSRQVIAEGSAKQVLANQEVHDVYSGKDFSINRGSNPMVIAKILLQITNGLMAVIAYYVNDTYFSRIEMNNLHLIFSNIVFVGCFLSFAFFITCVIFKRFDYGQVSPYDSALIFVALVGTIVTAMPFSLC